MNNSQFNGTQKFLHYQISLFSLAKRANHTVPCVTSIIDSWECEICLLGFFGPVLGARGDLWVHCRIKSLCERPEKHSEKFFSIRLENFQNFGLGIVGLKRIPRKHPLDYLPTLHQHTHNFIVFWIFNLNIFPCPFISRTFFYLTNYSQVKVLSCYNLFISSQSSSMMM